MRTPTTVLIDAQGRLRRQVFGMHDDLLLGAEVQTLLLEAQADPVFGVQRPATQGACDDTSCAVTAD